MRLRHWLGYAIKVAVSHSLYYTGVLHLLQRIRLKDKAVVLMYHRVLTFCPADGGREADVYRSLPR